ncbi:MAG: oligosaccharide flippase family protein [Rhodobacteraceae bacterium]|nr:oligosaccharide flippase family protein [Paracoccaceae bacterium]
MNGMLAVFRGGGLIARVLRSVSVVMMGYAGAQALRLASNLILARLLFPEAFGIMALVGVVTIGLAMFSDVGIGPSIAQSPRGDDPGFLNTAWTIQVARGFILWAVACLLASPMAAFYGDPELATYLPIAGASLAVAGFNPTRIETAARHLLLGRLTVLDLAAQAIGVVFMVAMAWATQSVMALVVGSVITAVAKLLLTHFGLPGPPNRFLWERESAGELVSFGKWIFLSTAFWFLSSQGDKAILGRYLSLEVLGVYNIGYFLAGFPLLLGQAVVQKVLIPVYRERPPGASARNAAQLRRMRHALTAGLVAMIAVMALAGPWLVSTLYDSRYAAAEGMIVVLACGMLTQAIGLSYDQAALAAGDSRRFFVFCGCRAVAQVGLLLIGVSMFGLLGALVAMALAAVIVHPVLIWLARTHGAWDAMHDMLWALAALGLAALAVWMHWGVIAPLA